MNMDTNMNTASTLRRMQNIHEHVHGHDQINRHGHVHGQRHEYGNKHFHIHGHRA
jgi:hypothetical protein